MPQVYYARLLIWGLNTGISTIGHKFATLHTLQVKKKSKMPLFSSLYSAHYYRKTGNHPRVMRKFQIVMNLGKIMSCCRLIH